jgi:hypothetical protein
LPEEYHATGTVITSFFQKAQRTVTLIKNCSTALQGISLQDVDRQQAALLPCKFTFPKGNGTILR